MALKTQIPLTSKPRQFVIKRHGFSGFSCIGAVGVPSTPRWCCHWCLIFLRGGAFGYSAAYRLPRMHPPLWVRVGRPRVASGSSWALHSLAHLAWTANSLSRSQAAVPSISAPASGSAPRQQSAGRSLSSRPRHSHARSLAPAVRGVCTALRGIIPRVLNRRLLPGHQPAW